MGSFWESFFGPVGGFWVGFWAGCCETVGGGFCAEVEGFDMAVVSFVGSKYCRGGGLPVNIIISHN